MSRIRIAPFLLARRRPGRAPPASRPGPPRDLRQRWSRSPSQLDGRAASLYPAPDGSGRYYLEARTGQPLRGRPREPHRRARRRRAHGRRPQRDQRRARHGRGRMYVLDPWQSTSVQGWRTSLQEVRQFTFVDERALLRRAHAARPTRRWAGSRSRPTASAARSCARLPRREPPAAPRPSSEQDDPARPQAAGANEAARDSAEAAARRRRGRRAGPVLSRARAGASARTTPSCS